MAKIIAEEWFRVVKKAKRKSASSIFSKWTYTVCKCVLESDRMTSILVRFYNTIVKKGYYPKRWIKLLAIILEKGKGPIIGKLRTI